MLKRNWALIALVYVALAQALSLAPVPDLSLCLIQPEHSQQSANHDDPKYCPAFHTGAALFFERTDHFLESHDKSVIGGFTIVLAISTIGLWLATNKLWAAGERQFRHAQSEVDAANSRWSAQFNQISAQIEALEQSARAAEENLFQAKRLADNAELTTKRQLRAYLVVEADTLEDFEAGRITRGRFNIRNVGQTPAHEVIMATAVELALRGQIPNFPAPLSAVLRAEPNARSAYFGDQNLHVEKDALRPFNQVEIDAVLADQSRVCVGGRVYYKDVFGDEWHTDFLYVYSGPETRAMVPHQYWSGNKAT